MSKAISFRDLEQTEGADHLWEPGESALDQWYAGVREIPISQFDDGDLCRACRQKMFLHYVVPIAIERLLIEPFAGEIYDGELFASLKTVPRDYWENNRTPAEKLHMLATRFLQQDVDTELRDDAREIVSIFMSNDDT